MKNSLNLKNGTKLGALLFSLAAFTGFSQSTTVTFLYTGAVQNFIVPPCVTTLTIEAKGAEGGGITATDMGNGAVITGNITVAPGDVLEVRVGGAGAIPAGGFNSGGNGGPATLVSDRAGGGGGASDVRITPYALGNRVIVAGGGGGYGGGDTDADGGLANCPNGGNGTTSWGVGGSGGTTVSGGAGGSPWGGGGWGGAGSLGVGGLGGVDVCFSRGPAGGAGSGLYGGGGGGSDCWAGGGSYGGGGGAAGSSLIPAGGSCVAGTNTGNGQVTITYVPAAPIGGTATAIPTTICDGETVDLSLAGYFGTTLQWESAPTSAGPFAPVVGATLDTYTTLPLGADICYRCAVTGCAMTVYSDTVCITVNPLPTIDAGLPVVVCDGDLVTLTAFNPDGAIVAWSGGITDGVAFVPPGATTTTYTVTADLLGCLSTDVVDVTSNPYPAVSAGVDKQICLGDPITLTGINPDGAIISWDLGVTDGVAFTPAGVGTVAHTVSADLLGCISTDVMNLTVNGLPVINAGPDQNLCQGVLVTVTGSGAGAGGSYSWDGGVIDGNPFMPPAGVTTTYTCTGTDANGCISTDQMDVIIISNPTVIITPSDTTGCEPFMVDFLDLSIPSGIDCIWDFGDGTTSTGCGSASHEFKQDGDYVVTLTVTIPGGCFGSGTANVHVIPFPIAEFAISNPVVTIENPTIQFSNSSLDATVYTWDFGDGSPLSSEEDPGHTFPDVPNEEYTVTLTASNYLGCTDVISKLIYVNDVIIFYVPNIFTPDGDAYNQTFQPVFYSGYDVYDFQMQIFNRWGEVVFETFDASKGWDGTYGDRGLVDDGTYTWFIEFKETMSDKRHKHRGHVTILK